MQLHTKKFKPALSYRNITTIIAVSNLLSKDHLYVLMKLDVIIKHH